MYGMSFHFGNCLCLHREGAVYVYGHTIGVSSPGSSSENKPVGEQ
jgi:hypothetical protein